MHSSIILLGLFSLSLVVTDDSSTVTTTIAPCSPGATDYDDVNCGSQWLQTLLGSSYPEYTTLSQSFDILNSSVYNLTDVAAELYDNITVLADNVTTLLNSNAASQIDTAILAAQELNTTAITSLATLSAAVPQISSTMDTQTSAFEEDVATFRDKLREWANTSFSADAGQATTHAAKTYEKFETAIGLVNAYITAMNTNSTNKLTLLQTDQALSKAYLQAESDMLFTQSNSLAGYYTDVKNILSSARSLANETVLGSVPYLAGVLTVAAAAQNASVQTAGAANLAEVDAIKSSLDWTPLLTTASEVEATIAGNVSAWEETLTEKAGAVTTLLSNSKTTIDESATTLLTQYKDALQARIEAAQGHSQDADYVIRNITQFQKDVVGNISASVAKADSNVTSAQQALSILASSLSSVSTSNVATLLAYFNGWKTNTTKAQQNFSDEIGLDVLAFENLLYEWNANLTSSLNNWTDNAALTTADTLSAVGELLDAQDESLGSTGVSLEGQVDKLIASDLAKLAPVIDNQGNTTMFLVNAALSHQSSSVTDAIAADLSGLTSAVSSASANLSTLDSAVAAIISDVKVPLSQAETAEATNENTIANVRAALEVAKPAVNNLLGDITKSFKDANDAFAVGIAANQTLFQRAINEAVKSFSKSDNDMFDAGIVSIGEPLTVIDEEMQRIAQTANRSIKLESDTFGEFKQNTTTLNTAISAISGNAAKTVGDLITDAQTSSTNRLTSLAGSIQEWVLGGQSALKTLSSTLTGEVSQAVTNLEQTIAGLDTSVGTLGSQADSGLGTRQTDISDHLGSLAQLKSNSEESMTAAESSLAGIISADAATLASQTQSVADVTADVNTLTSQVIDPDTLVKELQDAITAEAKEETLAAIQSLTGDSSLLEISSMQEDLDRADAREARNLLESLRLRKINSHRQ